MRGRDIMTTAFWEKINGVTGYFLFAAVVSLAVLSAHLEIKDLDLWLHLKTGQVITQEYQVPAKDILSATIASKDWNNHEWLFQVLVAKVHAFGGFDALILMQVIVVTITLLILLLTLYRRNQQAFLAIGLLLVTLVYQSRLTIRPDIFSVLYVTIFLSVLTKAHRENWALIVLALLQLCWVNMHGFFFMGPVLVWLCLIGLIINSWIKQERLDKGILPAASVILPLVSFANPLGVKGAIYPVMVLTHINKDASIFFNHIVELAKPITAATLFTDVHLYYKLLIIISAYTFIVNRRSLDWRVVLVWLFFLFFSLAAIRNMIFFGVVGCWAMMVNVQAITFERLVPIRFLDSRFKNITAMAVKILLVGWIISACTEILNNGYFDYDTYVRKSELEGISKRNFPYKAVDFLVNNQVKGNFFNDFNSGAYLIGRTYPNIKVFIDGRTELYGADFFKEYQQIWRKGDKRLFLDYAKKYNITGAFLNSYNQDIPSKCLRMFYHLKGWKIVYFAEDAVILLKDVPQHAALIKKYAIDLTKWQGAGIDLVKLGSRRVAPFPFVNRATSLYALKLYESAIRELKTAIKITPDYPPAYVLLGRAYLATQENQKAFEALRTALMLSPRDTRVRFWYAQSLERLKKYQASYDQYARILEERSQDKQAKDGLLRSLIGKGDIALKKKNFLGARALYQQAYVEGKYLDALKYRIGLTFLKSGDKIAARQYFNEGLTINPKHRGIKAVINQTK